MCTYNHQSIRYFLASFVNLLLLVSYIIAICSTHWMESTAFNARTIASKQFIGLWAVKKCQLYHFNLKDYSICDSYSEKRVPSLKQPWNIYCTIAMPLVCVLTLISTMIPAAIVVLPEIFKTKRTLCKLIILLVMLISGSFGMVSGFWVSFIVDQQNKTVGWASILTLATGTVQFLSCVVSGLCLL